MQSFKFGVTTSLFLLCFFACRIVGDGPVNGNTPLSVSSTLRAKKALGRAHDVEAAGPRVFVAGKSGSFAIVDVGSANDPSLLGSIDPGDDAQTVLPWNDHVMVGARDVVSVDVSNPRSPRIAGRVRDRPRVDRINGMVAWNKHLLYANKRGWIGAVDVSTPSDPELLGAVNTEKNGGFISPHDIARYRHYAVIVDQADGSPRKLGIYRVADPATGELLPVKQWTSVGKLSGKELNGANRVDIYDGYALVASNKADTVAVVDIRDPESPSLLNVWTFPDDEPDGLTVSGNALFVAGGRTVQVIDISSPENPEIMTTFKSESAFPSGTATGKRKTTVQGETKISRANAHDLVYQDDYLYVTAQSDDQLVILQVNDRTIRRLAEQPPPRFSAGATPVDARNPVTMNPRRRVRPQALVFGENHRLRKMLYSTDGSDKVSIATALATTPDGGETWDDHPGNPVLNRIESSWQGNRAFVTAVTRDEENDRWVMATVGDDTGESTPGLRAVGLWFSDDLIHWKQYEDNPIITVETDGARQNRNLFPGPDDPPVGMYLRDFQKIDGRWYALIQWRGKNTWSRMTVMKSTGDLTGPWQFRNLCIGPEQATDWFRRNRKLNWSQPVYVEGRWYAACQNGVGRSDQDNRKLGLVYSDDYFHWHEYNNPVTPELTRPDGSPVVSSQQFLLPPQGGKPWRILLGARGVHGDKYMYRVSPW